MVRRGSPPGRKTGRQWGTCNARVLSWLVLLQKRTASPAWCARASTEDDMRTRAAWCHRENSVLNCSQ